MKTTLAQVIKMKSDLKTLIRSKKDKFIAYKDLESMADTILNFNTNNQEKFTDFQKDYIKDSFLQIQQRHNNKFNSDISTELNQNMILIQRYIADTSIEKVIKNVKPLSNLSVKSCFKISDQHFIQDFLLCLMFYVYMVLNLEYTNLLIVKTDDNQINKNSDESFEPFDLNSSKLFPNGKPMVKDVKQTVVGNCFLLATLKSIAKTNPDFIIKCFVNRETYEEDDFALIRLYKVFIETDAALTIKATPLNPVIIKIQKTKFNKNSGAPWVELINKAWMVYYSDQNVKVDNSSPLAQVLAKVVNKEIRGGASTDKVSEGFCSIIMTAITKGSCSEIRIITNPGELSNDPTSVYNYIKNNAKSVPITTTTKSNIGLVPLPIAFNQEYIATKYLLSGPNKYFILKDPQFPHISFPVVKECFINFFKPVNAEVNLSDYENIDFGNINPPIKAKFINLKFPPVIQLFQRHVYSIKGAYDYKNSKIITLRDPNQDFSIPINLDTYINCFISINEIKL